MLAHPDEAYSALQYLQKEVAALVDHGDDEEERNFQLLASSLFKVKDSDDEIMPGKPAKSAEFVPIIFVDIPGTSSGDPLD